MRIAILADIHGNLDALEAVIADLRLEAPDLVVNLGDCVSGPLDPGLTADRLIDLGWPTVRGNHDRYIVEWSRETVERSREAMGTYEIDAIDRVTPAHLDWLGALPPTAQPVDGVLMCHATPACDETYLTETVGPHAVVLASEAELAERLGPGTPALVLCGHSHVPRLARLADGRTVFNPGAVGVQAYDDVTPWPHVIETGSPHARYGLIDAVAGGWRFSHRQVDYDWEAAARKAATAGRSDWVVALRTGFAERQAP
jgi:predicted phosphodiesterase